ncbi:class I SAM-dependent methyltransferase [Sorangium sp. So ce1036]|uniref:class I SAM-dependent methyltransferase n=1 Tax=Sorangium sp. So ce1036 TaxID=3133328 RepID=UPI003F0AAB5C
MNTTARYIHALGPAALTRFYDPVVRWVMREDAFRSRVLTHAELAPGQRLLDVGCGTGTLALLAKQRHPGVEVRGVDGDDKVLALAREKDERAGAGVRFERALAWALPYPDGTFDRVVSTLMFHHLTADDKQRTAREIVRVLRPGGALVLADLGSPRSAPGRALARALFRASRFEDHLAGRLPALLAGAGLSEVAEVDQHDVGPLPIAVIRGHKPRGDG